MTGIREEKETTQPADQLAPGKVDASLVKQLREGSFPAYQSLYAIYHKRLYAFAYSYFKSKELAEETVHDVFVKIWEGRAALNESSSFHSYIFTIARHLVIDTIRRYTHEQLYKQELRYRQENTHNWTEETMTLADYEAIARHAVEQLPEKRRAIFTLSREQNLTYAEIAGRLGISQKTVEAQMHKALAFVKDYLRRHSDIAISLFMTWLFT